MKRRVFLQKTSAGLGLFAGWPHASKGMAVALPAVAAQVPRTGIP
jgi:hypothetical protein